jgi:transposase
MHIQSNCGSGLSRPHEAGEGSYASIALRFGVGEASVKRWCWRYRSHGTVEPHPRGGGVHSQNTAQELEAILNRLGDANAGELTAEFNRNRRGRNRVHVSSMKRALHRYGYVVKKSASARSNNYGPMFRRSVEPS